MVTLNTFGASAARGFGFEGATATSTGTQTISGTCSGIYASGGGPNCAPGYQYAIGGGNAARVGIAPMSTTYQGDSSSTAWRWSRGFAFIHPYSTITEATLNSWGYLLSQTPRATDIRLTYMYLTLDNNYQVGYAKVTDGSTNIASYTGSTTILQFSDPGQGRSDHSYSGSLAVPNPAQNELVFMWFYDTPGGSNSMTMNMTYTGYTYG